MSYKFCICNGVLELEMKSDDFSLLSDIVDEVNRLLDETYPNIDG